MSTQTRSSAKGRAARQVRLATDADVPKLAQTMARAYHDDPVWSHLMPDEKRRRAGLPRYFEIELRHIVLPHGATWTTDDLVGGLLVTPPGKWRVPPQTMARRGPSFLRALGRDVVRSLLTLALLERKHPREPHYYIAYGGVDPDHWRGGIGRSLVAELIARCDSEGVPAYLEATSEVALAFYGGQGWEVRERVDLRGGPPVWLMWREPDRRAGSSLPTEVPL